MHILFAFVGLASPPMPTFFPGFSLFSAMQLVPTATKLELIRRLGLSGVGSCRPSACLL